jgi:sulfonate transport system permease protein
MPIVRARRAAVAIVGVVRLYVVAAQIAHGRLPTRVWMGAHYIDDVQLLPTWRSLAEEGAFLFESDLLPSSVAVSTTRVLLGLVLGSITGVLMGLATGWAARFEWVADPWVTLFRFTPALALLPLFVVWFGYGELPKVLLIASGVAVVMLLGTHHAVRAVPRVYLDAARSLGCSGRLVFRRIVLPFAVPQILSSLRVAVALAWVTIVVAELIDARMPSLGYLLALSGAYPRVPQMIIGIATVGVLVLAFDLATLLLHRRATRWMKRAA